jgi:hypothetical protein
MYSSIYFNKSKSIVHLWEYIDGIKTHSTHEAPLYFYKLDPNGEFTSIYGEKLKKVQCKTFNEYQEKIENLKMMGKKLYESDVSVDSKFIIERYIGQELQPRNLIYILLILRFIRRTDSLPPMKQNIQ